eukprot:gene34150-biopygen22180
MAVENRLAVPADSIPDAHCFVGRTGEDNPPVGDGKGRMETAVTQPRESSRNDISGNCKTILEDHSGPINAISILTDDRIADGYLDETVRIWNVISVECERILEGHSGWITAIFILPDGQIVSGSADKTVRIWNAIGHVDSSRAADHAHCLIVRAGDDPTFREYGES